jgi:hypothetical protein
VAMMPFVVQSRIYDLDQHMMFEHHKLAWVRGPWCWCQGG